MLRTAVICLAFMGLGASVSGATELVYTPVNPSFGGNPINGQYLLTVAQAQNKFKEETPSRTAKSPIETFEDTLLRRVLNNIAYDVVDTAFGTTGEELAGGHYEFGDYEIDVSNPTGDSISVVISDTATGGQTTIEVPLNY